MIDLEFTALFPFSGLGGGAGGICESVIKSQGHRVRFKSLGGFDIDPGACRDFEMLTQSPAYCLDMHAITVDVLRSLWPDGADFVFTSAPCTGLSGLLPDQKAKTAHYQVMNQLGVLFIRRALEAWSHRLPGMILFENVPRMASRGRHVADTLHSLLRDAGYVTTEGFHECGELGNLAQKRKRWLLIARNPQRVAQLLYQPIKRKIRACGEVLETLPMPDEPTMGPMHELPGISWLNAVRLALIPAGGDWRDLPGVLEAGQTRREKFRRQKLEAWSEPTSTITGPGKNAVGAVADPRIGQSPNAHENKFRVTGWDRPVGTVIGATRPGSGAPSVADPRYGHVDRVTPWDRPVGTITHSPAPSSGGGAVADPRIAKKKGSNFNTLMVVPWKEPARTVTGEARPTTGAFSVADPRCKTGFDHAYRVLSMGEPSFTVHGKAHPGTGAYSIADPRHNRALAMGTMSVDEAARTVTGDLQGPFAIVDQRSHDTIAIVRDHKRAPSQKPNQGYAPIIVAKDGTWHRPLTTLELAALQSMPVMVRGKPLVLSGKSHTAWRMRIGNAVPWMTAKAIGEEILLTLLNTVTGFSLTSNGTIWVETDEDAYPVELIQ